MQNVFPEYKKEIVLGKNGLCLKPMEYRVLYKEKEVKITPKEFEVLYLLAQRPGWIFTREIIYSAIWEDIDGDVPYSTIHNTIYKLRKKLGKDVIITVSKIGYKLKNFDEG